MKLIRIILFHLFLLIFLSLIGLGYFLAFTTSGLQLAISIGSTFLPGDVKIKQYAGNLWEGFSLYNVSYTDKQQQTTIGLLQLNLRPRALLYKKIVIDSATIQHVRIDLRSTQSSSSAANASTDDLDLSNLSYLDYLVIKHLRIEDVLLNGKLNGIAIHGTVNLLLENNVFNIYDTQFQAADSIITIQGTVTKNWHLQWEILAPHLNTLVPDLFGTLKNSGTITGAVISPTLTTTLTAKNLRYHEDKIGQITGNATINFNNQVASVVSLSLRNLKIKDYVLKSINLTTNGKLTNGQLAAQLKLFINNHQDQITSMVLLPRFKLVDANQPINANLNLRFNDFNTLIHPTPYAKHLRGLLTGEMKVTGTLLHPAITGYLSLTNGHIKMTKFGIKINDLKINTRFDNDKQMVLTGGCRAGKGTATFQGDIHLDPLSAKLKLVGENLKVMNTPEYRVLASPDLELEINNDKYNLSGKIVIPSANITPSAYSNTVTLPSDVVFVGQAVAARPPPIDFSMQIKLKLGDDINFSYTDLTTKLGGNLFISEMLAGPIIASGELYAIKGTGTYKAYGQVLKLQEGRIIYTGNTITNPGLDIKAVKTIRLVSAALQSTYSGLDQVTVGVQVTGTVNHPSVVLFSDSGLSQEDILSYMLFGYPKSQISGASGLNLLSAATYSLNEGKTSQIGNVTEKLQNALGLTELTTESTEIFNPSTNKLETATTVGVGKKLAPNLYLHYNMGLFSPVSILNIRYQFNKHWAVQAETSTIDNGADILYGFDFD